MGTPHTHLKDTEALDERRTQAQNNVLTYQRRIAQSDNKLVRPRIFKKGDLVLVAADHIKRDAHTTKFTPNWLLQA